MTWLSRSFIPVLLGLSLGLSACTSEDQASSRMSAQERAAARASVDISRDCNKPWFDTVSASDRTTVVKGMTPIEREVCAEQIRNGQQQGR